MNAESPRQPCPPPTGVGRVRFGPFVADRAARTLTRGDQPRHLQPRVFDLLDALLRNPGRVLAKQELLETVWGGRPLTDGVLAQAIAELRRAIDDRGDAAGARWVVTVHRVGYRFDGAVEALPEPRPAPVVDAPRPDIPRPMAAEPGPGPEPGKQAARAPAPASGRRSVAARQGLPVLVLLVAALLAAAYAIAGRQPESLAASGVGLLPVLLEPVAAAEAPAAEPLRRPLALDALLHLRLDDDPAAPSVHVSLLAHAGGTSWTESLRLESAEPRKIADALAALLAARMAAVDGHPVEPPIDPQSPRLALAAEAALAARPR